MARVMVSASCVDAGFVRRGFGFAPREIARYHVELWFWTPKTGDKVWRVTKKDFYFNEPEKVMLFDSFDKAFKKFSRLGGKL